MFFTRNRIQVIESDVERIWLAAGIFDCQKKLRASPPEEARDLTYGVKEVKHYVDHILEGEFSEALLNSEAQPTHFFVCDALDGVFVMKLSGEQSLGYIARIDHKHLLEDSRLSGLPILVFPKVLRSGKTYKMTLEDGEVDVFFTDNKLYLKVK